MRSVSPSPRVARLDEQGRVPSQEVRASSRLIQRPTADALASELAYATRPPSQSVTYYVTLFREAGREIWIVTARGTGTISSRVAPAP